MRLRGCNMSTNETSSYSGPMDEFFSKIPTEAAVGIAVLASCVLCIVKRVCRHMGSFWHRLYLHVAKQLLPGGTTASRSPAIHRGGTFTRENLRANSKRAVESIQSSEACYDIQGLIGRLLLYPPALLLAVRWKVVVEVLLLMLWSIVISGEHDFFWDEMDHVASGAVGVLGVLLIFLTTFRSTHAYSRWWESRILWGKIIGATMNLTQQAALWMGAEHTALTERITRYCIAYAITSKHLLREGISSRARRTDRGCVSRAALAPAAHDHARSGRQPHVSTCGCSNQRTNQRRVVDRRQTLYLSSTLSDSVPHHLTQGGRPSPDALPRARRWRSGYAWDSLTRGRVLPGRAGDHVQALLRPRGAAHMSLLACEGARWCCVMRES